MPKLVIRKGEKELGTFIIEKEITCLGRLPSNDVHLDSTQVSRNHAKIEYRDNSYIIFDLDSTNGTTVNGHPIKERNLHHYDEIIIGDFILDFEPVEDKIIFTPEENMIVFRLVGYALNSKMTLKGILNVVMGLIFRAVNAERGCIMLIDDKTGELIPQVIHYKDYSSKGEEKERITISNTIIKKVLKEKAAIITSNALSDPRFLEKKSIISHGIRSAMCAPLMTNEKLIGIINVDCFQTNYQFTVDDLNLLKSLADFASVGIEQIRLNQRIEEETRIRSSLERYHSPDVVDLIVNDSKKKQIISLEAKSQIVTILFCDIKDFTPLAETLRPEEIAQLLNDYFTMMTDVIFDYHGTLDKYIGDAVMAIFGAPFSYDTPKDDAYNAVEAALQMVRKLNEFNESLLDSMRFSVKIGINTGEVVAGNIGSLKRIEYTVLGDVVNVASRLADMAQTNQIYIGKETYDNVKEFFEIKAIGDKTIKGRKKAIKIYEVLDRKNK